MKCLLYLFILSSITSLICSISFSCHLNKENKDLSIVKEFIKDYSTILNNDLAYNGLMSNFKMYILSRNEKYYDRSIINLRNLNELNFISEKIGNPYFTKNHIEITSIINKYAGYIEQVNGDNLSSFDMLSDVMDSDESDVSKIVNAMYNISYQLKCRLREKNDSVSVFLYFSIFFALLSVFISLYTSCKYKKNGKYLVGVKRERALIYSEQKDIEIKIKKIERVILNIGCNHKGKSLSDRYLISGSGLDIRLAKLVITVLLNRFKVGFNIYNNYLLIMPSDKNSVYLRKANSIMVKLNLNAFIEGIE